MRNWKRKLGLLLLLAFAIWWWFCLPSPLFRTPYSSVLEAREGSLLGAHIAEDGQWRFPAPDSLPDKLQKAIVTFEDKRFYQHPGVDIRAVGRALRQNWRAGEIVSGGSTLSMQVMRLAGNQPPRTFGRKLKEALQALRLEWRYSKDDILKLWASQAPFGGNVVGVEAATWRYFGKPLERLSWAEAATLAVLPNSPGLMHPGRNRTALMKKRDRLLLRLSAAGYLDELSLELARAEALPPAPYDLPRLAPHLQERSRIQYGGGRYRTTLDPHLQESLNEIVQRGHKTLAANQIHNLAAIIVDVESGSTLAYVGNVSGIANEHSPAVDLITAPRSPGSLLKPLLYGLALQDGQLLPQAWLPDVPRQFLSFKPENFHRLYDGLVPADQALSRSLNVPFVSLLQDYGVARFHQALQDWNFRWINKTPDHYGLTLILGGCEISLWEAVGWYASMARMIRHYPQLQSRYDPNNWRMPHYLVQDTPRGDMQPQRAANLLGAGAAWFTLSAMQEVSRPDEEGEWQRFASSRPIAWKTGTSHGFRDAWAVGVSGRYAIGVWAGNADGEGRPGLVGIRAAAPVLFEIIQQLPPDREWYPVPYDDLRPGVVCRISGHPALPFCPQDTILLPKKATEAQPCSYHQEILTDQNKNYRLRMHCAQAQDLYRHAYLKLSPMEEHYYQKRHPDYTPLPPWRPDCAPEPSTQQAMQLIYPPSPKRIKVPRNLDGEASATVFSLAHRQSKIAVYWHLDNHYLGQTLDYHSMELKPAPGIHRLVVVDAEGNRLEQSFEVVE